MMRGPSVPSEPYKGTRYDPPEAWLFGKGVFGPPDERTVTLHRVAPNKFGSFESGKVRYVSEMTVETAISVGFLTRDRVAQWNITKKKDTTND